ncbi:MAG: extensin family protein [Geminicoccaceae bacterium]
MALGFILLSGAGCSWFGGGPGKARFAPLTLPQGASCMNSLAATGAQFTPMASLGSGACTVPTPVRVTSLNGTALNQPLSTACATALRLAEVERDSWRPQAERQMGAALVRINHFGSFSCRRMTGGRKLSLHGKGLAVDIASFTFANGETVDVSKDWGDWWSDPADFLEVATRGACKRFNLVLTPESDRFHHNHLHLDLGPYRRCDV